MSDRSRPLLANLAGLFGGRGLGLALSLVSVPVVAHQLGASGFGMWSLCALLIGWVQVMDLGLGFGLQNDVSLAEDAAAQERAARSARAMAAAMTVLAAMVVLIGGGAALWPGSLAVFGPDLPDAQHALGQGMLLITAVAMAASLLVQVPLRCLAGRQLLGRASLAQSLGAVAGFAVLAAGPLLGLHPLAGIAAMALLPIAAQLVEARRALAAPALAWLAAPVRWAWSDLPPMLRRGGWFLASQLSALIVFQTDALIISATLGVVESGSYQAAGRLYLLVAMVHGLVLAAAWPSIASARAGGDHAWIGRLFAHARLLTLVLIVATAAIAPLVPWVVERWTGQPALRPSPALSWGLAAMTMTALWSALHAQVLNAMDDHRFPARLAIVQAALNLPAVLVAVHLAGSAGAAWASAAVALATSCPLLAWRWRLHRDGGSAVPA